MSALTSAGPEIMLMVVLHFGKQINFAWWREKALNSRDLVFVIMLPNFLFWRQMMKVKSRRVLIGNIHVIYNPNRGDVKLGQVRLLSSKAEILSKKWGNIPIVLAGDFNSTPQV